jgi:hypothetical protein
MEQGAGFIRIADETFTIEKATFFGYHCAGKEADWNIELECGGESRWLSGRLRPGRSTTAELDGSQARIDLRSLDDVFAALLRRAITSFPLGIDPGHGFVVPVAAAADRIRLRVVFVFDWDHQLATFSTPESRSAELDVTAFVAALKPHSLEA